MVSVISISSSTSWVIIITDRPMDFNFCSSSYSLRLLLSDRDWVISSRRIMSVNG